MDRSESPLLRELCSTAERWIAEEPGRDQSAVAQVLSLLQHELVAAGPSSTLVPALTESLRIYVQRLDGSVQTSPDAVRAMGDARIWKAVGFMQRDLAKRWTVRALAKAVGMSRPVFARLFVSTTGLSPLRYLTRCRMELAAALLRESDAGLSQVAGQIGYESEYAFSRAFKRHHGVAPHHLRHRPLSGAVVALRSAA